MTGEDILRARVALDMSQAALAAAIGTDRKTVNRWERNRCKPSPLAIRRLREYLAVQIG
jgi:DNA-binding transcriptional regulator YiaG